MMENNKILQIILFAKAAFSQKSQQNITSAKK